MVFSPGFQVNDLMCMVAGCTNTVCAKGLCRSHYDRDRHSGSPLKPLRQRMCPQCHVWFDPKRSDQLFCSGRCRVAYKRARDRDGSLPLKPVTTMYVKQVDRDDVGPELVVEAFTDSQVVDKCGGLCAVCHEPVVLNSGGDDGPAFIWKVPLEKSLQATLKNRLLVHKRCEGGTP